MVQATPKELQQAIVTGIRKTLLELGSSTKAELSQRLGISFPTVTKFLKQMEEKEEVRLVGMDDSSGGRRAKRYEYNVDFRRGLSIFLEKTETSYTVFNCAGEVKKQEQVPTVLAGGGLELLAGRIQSICLDDPRIQSIAIGVPGSVENGRIFFMPEYPDFQHVQLQEYIEAACGIPVVVENDMNAAVLGYQQTEKVEKEHSLAYLYLGKNGPGAGILVNGDVVRGGTFFSGEVSFVPQYDELTFQQALQQQPELGEKKVDAISRMVATFAAILNPYAVLFSAEEIGEEMLEDIRLRSERYIPAEHLPKLIASNWRRDYLHGLQCLGLVMMLEQS
ncbi:ROK family transcriptional regulator [Domibacillus enclensis]|uniref:Transcriptional regulator n=1 Tax=Domibacillus enclensis TaxID=1017273 RepID=A0A1N6XXL1_9BACI|nr:ROK family transcriptional regulator [Domibacillus enclensis]SIR07044.1 transcriptional regulator [Domibacillus enclensis]